MPRKYFCISPNWNKDQRNADKTFEGEFFVLNLRIFKNDTCSMFILNLLCVDYNAALIGCGC